MFEDYETMEELLDSVFSNELSQEDIDSLPLSVRESIIEELYERQHYCSRRTKVYSIELEVDEQWPYK